MMSARLWRLWSLSRKQQQHAWRRPLISSPSDRLWCTENLTGRRSLAIFVDVGHGTQRENRSLREGLIGKIQHEQTNGGPQKSRYQLRLDCRTLHSQAKQRQQQYSLEKESALSSVVSAEQKRELQVEWDRMEEATDRILQLDTTSSELFATKTLQEVQTALNYWSSRWLSGDFQMSSLFYAAQRAEELLDWVLCHCDDPRRLETVLVVDQAYPNTILVNLIRAYLYPVSSKTPTSPTFFAATFATRHGVQNKTTNNEYGLWATEPVRHAVRMLDKMNHVHDKVRSENGDSSSHLLRPDTVSSTATLNVWAKQGQYLSPENSDRILRQMKDLIGEMEQHENPRARPDAYSYTILLWNLVRQGHLQDAESCLRRMEDGRAAAAPDVVSYNAILSGYAEASGKRPRHHCQHLSADTKQHPCDAAEALLRQMMETPHSPPDVVSYATVLRAYTRAGRPDDAERLLDHMESQGDPPPNASCYNAVMDAWARRLENQGEDAAHRAEAVLHRAIAAGNKVDTKSFRIVVVAWARSSSMDAASRAEALLRQSMDQFDLEPDGMAFNAVLNAWTKQIRNHNRNSRTSTNSRARTIDPQHALERCEAILQEMKELEGWADGQMYPSTVSYTALLDAYAESFANNNNNAHVYNDRVDEVLQSMLRSESPRCSPDTFTYNVVLKAKARALSSTQNLAFLEQMEAILRTMEEGKVSCSSNHSQKCYPDKVSYTTVMDAIAKSGLPDAGTRAEELLAHLERQQQDDTGRRFIVHLTTFTYNTVLNAWSKSLHPDKADRATILRRMRKSDRIQPNVVSYSTVLDTFSRSIDSSGRGKCMATRAEQLLESMEKKSEYVTPDTACYNAVLRALSRSPQPGAARRAEALLERMLGTGDDHANEKSNGRSPNANHRPEVTSLTSVTTAWGRSGEDGAAEHAERISHRLEEMSDDEKNTGARPDHLCYGSVISAWAKSGAADAPHRALAVLERMRQRHEKDPNNSPSPTTVCYNAVLSALANSKMPDKAERAFGLLEMMERFGGMDYRPDAATYATVLKACASPGSNSTHKERRVALAVAKETYEAFMAQQGHAKQRWSSTVLSAKSHLQQKTDGQKFYGVFSMMFLCLSRLMPVEEKVSGRKSCSFSLSDDEDNQRGGRDDWIRSVFTDYKTLLSSITRSNRPKREYNNRVLRRLKEATAANTELYTELVGVNLPPHQGRA